MCIENIIDIFCEYFLFCATIVINVLKYNFMNIIKSDIYIIWYILYIVTNIHYILVDISYIEISVWRKCWNKNEVIMIYVNEYSLSMYLSYS